MLALLEELGELHEVEREVVAAGTTVIKVALVVSREKQKQRLIDRLNDPTKYWKFDPSDVEERGFWEDYLEAYQTIFDRTEQAVEPGLNKLISQLGGFGNRTGRRNTMLDSGDLRVKHGKLDSTASNSRVKLRPKIPWPPSGSPRPDSGPSCRSAWSSRPRAVSSSTGSSPSTASVSPAKAVSSRTAGSVEARSSTCPLYTSDAADERSSVDLGGRRIIITQNQTTLLPTRTYICT